MLNNDKKLGRVQRLVEKNDGQLKIKACRICQFPITLGNLTFVIETSSRTHFKDNLTLIKD